MIVGILSFTVKGKALEDRLRLILEKDLGFQVLVGLEDKKNWVCRIFEQVDALIFIGATGIAVRYIAPLIRSKDTDPGVIVIDELGNFVIPILSGHIGGANALGKKLSEELEATCVITTATDINKVLAIDSYAMEKGYAIDNIDKIKFVSSALLRGEEVGFYSDLRTYEVPEGLKEGLESEVGVCLSYKESLSPFAKTLKLIPKTLVMGIGCRKNTESETMRRWVLEKLRENDISPKAVRAIASIELKAEEGCILAFAEQLNVEFKVFSAESLAQVEGSSASSNFVKSVVGVDNVCERAAILEGDGPLIVKKIAENGMTLAIAESR